MIAAITAIPGYGFYVSPSRMGWISSVGYFKRVIRALNLKDMQLPDARVAALLDAAPDAMVVSDGAGTIKLINAQAERLFGYSRDELLEQALELLLPDRLREAHAAHREAYGRAPRVRRMGSGLELVALHKEGREFPVEISLSPLDTESGPLILSAVRDISARKAVQTALVEARWEAERASRAKSAFLAAASHDLRQPLQTLTLLNSALSRIAPPGSRIAEIAASQEHAIRSMSDLLNSLLDISKLEAGAVKPEIRDCSLGPILARLEAQFSAQASAKRLNLRCDECDGVVRTDPALLEQILANLVVNAIRYTEDGYVALQCADEGNAIRIEVHDTGVGIPADEIDMIFEQFYRVRPEADRGREKGLGLGLSIVRRTAGLLGHRLDVESTPGKGSCFAVTVPAGDDQTSETPEPMGSSLSQDRFDSMVLVVDDDAAVADATVLFLNATGYQAMAASGLEDARAHFANAARIPDALICDFHLAGGENGVGTIERIRRLWGRTIPAVLITGDTSAVMPDVLASVPDCYLLSKPVDSSSLAALLQSLTAREI